MEGGKQLVSLSFKEQMEELRRQKAAREAKIAERLVILDPEVPSFERQVGCGKDQ